MAWSHEASSVQIRRSTSQLGLRHPRDGRQDLRVLSEGAIRDSLRRLRSLLQSLQHLCPMYASAVIHRPYALALIISHSRPTERHAMPPCSRHLRLLHLRLVLCLCVGLWLADTRDRAAATAGTPFEQSASALLGSLFWDDSEAFLARVRCKDRELTEAVTFPLLQSQSQRADIEA